MSLYIQFKMRISSLIPLALASQSHLTTAAYTLKTDYGNTMSFFDKFTFFTVRTNPSPISP